MVDLVTRRTFCQASRSLAVVAALGLGGTLAGCADIHPEPNDPDEGLMDAPTDEAEHFQEQEAREEEHGDEGRK